MKIYIKCKIEKDDIEFYFIKSTKRFMSNCKLCEKQNRKERYDKNPEYFLSRNQRYFERNKNNIITQRKNSAKLQETKKRN